MADFQVQPPVRRAPRGRAWDRGPLVLVDNLVKPGPLSAVRSGCVINKYFCSRGLDVLDDRLQPGDPLKRETLLHGQQFIWQGNVILNRAIGPNVIDRVRHQAVTAPF